MRFAAGRRLGAQWRRRARWLLTTALAASLAACGPSKDRSGGTGPALGEAAFTPAHNSAAGAIRDYFNVRSTPVQPIAYTHKVHLANGMQCANCHVGVDSGAEPPLPSVKLCMACHQVVDKDRPEIIKMTALFARGEEVGWQRVYAYRLENHVRFLHGPHMRAGVDCKLCHGDMTQQTVAVRAVDLNMGFCLSCHRQKAASIDCTTCHF